MPFQVYLQNKVYSPRELLHPEPIAAAPDHEREALLFVKQWLGGQQDFSIQTSGSTGTPKQINVNRQRMQASARLTLQALGIAEGDEALLCLHPGYIGGKMMLVRAMEGQLPLRVVPPAADPLEQLPAGAQPLFTALVPLQLQAILAAPRSLEKLNSMKAVIVGGAPVSAALEAEVQGVRVPLYSTYGMTETVSHIALRRLNGPEKQTYFEALPDIRLSLDGRGCLCIDGPVVEAPVQTNDVVELLSDRRFRWLGRADHVINSGGVKVQAEQVEAVAEESMQQLRLQGRVLAGGLADDKLGQRLVLLLEREALSRQDEEGLLTLLRAKLPLYWAPKQIFYLPKFVESTNGKILRHATWALL